MEKNRLLDFAASISNIMKYGFKLLIAIMTFALIHWHFSPETYRNIAVTIDKSGEVVYVFADDAFLVAPDNNAPQYSANNKEKIYLTQINKRSLYIYYLQSVGTLVLLVLILRQLVKIIESVKALETFKSDNSKAFRKIGFYCLYMALLTTFTWYTIDSTFFAIHFRFTPLAFALGAFILAEIFKEGNKLYEAEQLTI